MRGSRLIDRRDFLACVPDSALGARLSLEAHDPLAGTNPWSMVSRQPPSRPSCAYRTAVAQKVSDAAVTEVGALDPEKSRALSEEELLARAEQYPRAGRHPRRCGAGHATPTGQAR